MKKDDILEKYHAKVFKESVIKSLLYGLIAGCIVVGVVSFILFAFGTKNLLITLLLGFIIMLGVTIYVYKTKFRPTVNAVAKRIDELGLHERVITMVDYADNESLICVKQREDTQEKLANVGTKEIKFKFSKLSLVLLAFVLILAGSSLLLPNRRSGIGANSNNSTSSSGSFNNSTNSSNSSINVDDEIDKIIQEMIEELRRIIDNADISDISKNKLHTMVDEMVVELEDAETVGDKIQIIQNTKQEIYNQIELMKSVAKSLQENESTKKLGEAIASAEGLKDEEAIASLINSSISNLIEELENSGNPEQFILDLTEGLENAISLATEEENEELLIALENLCNQLKNNSIEKNQQKHYRENIALLAESEYGSVLDAARQEIIDALLPKPEDPDDKDKNDDSQNNSSNQNNSSSQTNSSNQEQSSNQNSSNGQSNSSSQNQSSGDQNDQSQDVDQTQKEIDDAMQDTLDKIEQMNPDNDNQNPGTDPGDDDNQNSTDPDDPNNQPIFGSSDDPYESETVIDGQTPYLDVYEEYYNEIMDYLSGNEVPDDLREIIEKYLEMIKG